MNAIVPDEYFQEAKLSIPELSAKLSLNSPTANFFYDPWIIKPEYVGTVWDKLLKTLPVNIGEARLISLDIESCYTVHADIDNRYHYTFDSEDSFLVDVGSRTMHTLSPGQWYYMDAGKLHSAVNFGSKPRVSLVVRELLPTCQLTTSKLVKIIPDTTRHDYRFRFDQVYSQLLNCWQSSGKLSNFSVEDSGVSFLLDTDVVVPLHSGFEVIDGA